ncbi:hypothetical protein M9Y10_010572 [Tritrichomonas musculus]|uniref:Uncharacterized protein n=1 Tax=Tritrichomonas musculus TaxID=1915356 RepID=A0ABR2IL63_9EUKA
MNLIYIEENISFDVFEQFISSINMKEIEITDNNYEAFYYLSCKYKFPELKKEIKDFIKIRPDIETIIKHLSQSGNSKPKTADQPDFLTEEIIAKNLDFSISSGLLNKAPINILLRILNSPKREIKNDKLFFQFGITIFKDASKSEDEEEIENLSILPSCLDFCILTSSEIEDLIQL